MNYYLIHIQYLGFRFHGWQKQPGVKTVESMVFKTVEFVLGHSDFKVLGSSRTDAMVSANQTAFELFLDEDLDTERFLTAFNANLPPDIRALDMTCVDKNFNIINSPRVKEYLYLFSWGEKFHPFCAPFMTYVDCPLDVELMKEGARLFEGCHNFIRYCTKPSADTCLERDILVSRIETNTYYKASFFPDQTWAYRVRSKGFMRHQIRLMMGQLFALGKNEIGLKDIQTSLLGEDKRPFKTIAPASGLILNTIDFKGEHDR